MDLQIPEMRVQVPSQHLPDSQTQRFHVRLADGDGTEYEVALWGVWSSALVHIEEMHSGDLS